MTFFSLASIVPFVFAAQLFAQAPAAAPAVAPAAAWPANAAGLKALATSLINELFAKFVAGDTAAIEAGMQPNVQLLAFDGVSDFATTAARINASLSKAQTISDVIATRVGDALITTCLASITQTLGGKSVTSDAVPRIGVWQIVDGSWKLAAWASLSMPEPRPAPSAPTFAGDAALNAEGSAMVMKFLTAQHTKDMSAFEAMLADGMQTVNFKGQKLREDMIKGAKAATTSAPVIADARTTRCGDLTVVTCTLTMSQKVAFSSLPADPAPFMTVFTGAGASAKVIALANTNKPK